jgi:signal transduction histidine kinase
VPAATSVRATPRSHFVEPMIQDALGTTAHVCAMLKAGDIEGAIKQVKAGTDRLVSGLRTFGDYEALRDQALATLPLDDRFASLVEGTRSLLETQVVALFFIDEERAALWPHVTSGFQTIAGVMPLPIEGRTHQVVVDGKPLLIDHLESDEPFDKRLIKEGIKSVIVVPLRVGDKVGGVLMCGHPGIGKFQPKDVELLGLVADRLGASMESGRLQDAQAKGLKDAEARSAFNTNLMRMATHDLKTPLTAISMQLHLLTKPPVSDQQLSKAASLIERNVQRLSALLDDFLDLARVEARQLTLHPVEFDVRELLAECQETFEAQAEQKGLKLTVEAPPGLFAHGDRRRIGQVVANLASNAIRYSESGTIKMSAVPSGRGVCLSVQDEGRGLTADEIAGLFRPFSQVAPHQQQGTGLGLYLSKSIVDAHGGRISLESPGHGHGTRAIVELPGQTP